MEETTPSVLLYYNGRCNTIMEETTPSVLLYYNGRNNTKCTFILLYTKCAFIL